MKLPATLKLIATICYFITALTAYSQDSTSEVIIISTNDVHGRIDNFSKMAAYVKALKKTHKDVYVFNGGDLINGNPVVDEAKEKGYPIFDLMNSIPYTISCLGNHEFENGEAVLQSRLKQSTSIYVDANVNVSNTSVLKPLKPYHILHTSDGSSIAVLGLSAAGSNPCVVKNVTVSDYVKTAQAYQWLRDSNQVFMALTHIGYKADSILATKIKGLDVIVGGHSHTEIPQGILVNGTLITQAGDKLRYIGKTVLTINNHRVVSKSFEMVNVAQLTEIDTAVQAKIDAYNNNPAFGKVVGFATTDFNNQEAMGCLKTDALVSALHLDIAFDHVRNIAYSEFSKGNITLGNIYEWDSYDYKTMEYQLTAADIRQLILNSMKKAAQPVLFVSGITYTLIKNAKGVKDSVLVKNKDGLLDESKHFLVGMNSFIACQFMRGITAPATEVSTTSAEALIAYLQRHKQVDYLNVKRVFIQ